MKRLSLPLLPNPYTIHYHLQRLAEHGYLLGAAQLTTSSGPTA